MKYIKITLESDLCVASGESGGNAIDNNICVNSYGIPYIPARRIRGCLRSSAEELCEMGYPLAIPENISILFGDAFGKEGILHIMDGNMEGIGSLNNYLRLIRNDEKASRVLKKASHPVYIENIFSSVQGQTRMQNGVKVDNTLRFTKILNQYDPLAVPDNNGKIPKMVFEAPISLDIIDEKETMEELLTASCKALRHFGLNRNRGLGNVRVEIIEKNTDGNVYIVPDYDSELDKLNCNADDQIEISYHIVLDSPITIPGVESDETSIPGRSVIGCMAGNYLSENSVDNTFRDLFLNGNVVWTPLTPVINGRISDPAPMMLMELKNGGKRMINRYSERDSAWKSLKPKTLDGAYSVMTKDGFDIGDPLIKMTYHHSIQQEMLYTQNAVENGLIYGGSVIIKNGNKELVKEVVKLLKECKIRFGRSKGAQYSECRLVRIDTPRIIVRETREISGREPIFVVLRSDLIIKKDGVYCADPETVRMALFDAINKTCKSGIVIDKDGSPMNPEGITDVCQYKIIGGYQTMWHLQKPHVLTIKAGSVYCFMTEGGQVPDTISIGEYTQEGFGRCKVFSLGELYEKQKINKSQIDVENNTGDDLRIEQLETAMRVYVSKEVFKRYAREYVVANRNLPISRIRLMLSESSSYKDLLKRVSTMKTSDRSSVNEKGKRTVTQELLNDFYGSDGIKKILETEPGLYEELENDKNAYKQVQEMWKLPLDLLLHNMHYSKERKGKK